MGVCEIVLDWVGRIVPVAVLVTLVILLHQTRLLRLAMQSTALSSIVGQQLQVYSDLLRLPAEVKRRFVPELVGASEDELDSHLIAKSLIDVYEGVYMQHKLAKLPPTAWPGWRGFIPARISGAEPLRAAWSVIASSGWMDEDFVNFVNQGLEPHDRDRASAQSVARDDAGPGIGGH